MNLNVRWTETLLPFLMIGVSFGIHLSVFAMSYSSTYVPVAVWNGDLRIFVVLSLILSAGMWIPQLKRAKPAFLGIRFLLYMVVGASVSAPPFPSLLILAALTADAGSTFSFPWNGIAVLVVGMAVFFGEIVPTSLDPTLLGKSDLLPLLPILGTITGFAIAIRLLIDKVTAMEETVRTLDDAVVQLTTANSGFLRYASNAERESALDERRRITRELHDIVGQALTDIIAMMDAAVRNPMDTVGEQVKLNQWVRDHSQHCLQETRDVLYRLRAMPDRPLTGTAAIQNLVKTFEYSTGVTVRLDWSNTPVDFGAHLNTLCYRVVQESLVNAFRHGRAGSVLILFRREKEAIIIGIEDDGRGSAGAKKGLGQSGMEERVREAGGTIDFQSTGRGYRVRVSIPVR